MAMGYDEIYDVIETFKARCGEEEWTSEQVLELVEKEIERYEIEEYR